MNVEMIRIRNLELEILKTKCIKRRTKNFAQVPASRSAQKSSDLCPDKYLLYICVKADA